jgi:hypothetical protein
MLVAARPYTTAWGLLKQPDKHKPSNVGEVGGDRVAELEDVIWSWHPRMINQRKGYAVVF